jgi:hypothetical protein
MEVLQFRQANTVVPFIHQALDIQDVAVIEEVTPQVITSTKRSPFIEANTSAITLAELKKDFIPVFAKDNESTISHLEFIETVYNTVNSVFPRESLSNAECRVSHKICGRIPSAVGKPANQLQEWEKTQYYERLAFCIEVKSITDTISGNQLTLSIVGVRAYNHTNLYGRKGQETFKLAIGFNNQVCTNLCVSSEGLATEIRVINVQDLQRQALELLYNYNAQAHLNNMKQLPDMGLSESQFATLLGRTRLYQFLPKKVQKELPPLAFGDSHLNTIAKDYYNDKRFCRSDDGYLDLWNLYNLFTNANRSSSYIDTFLDRSNNATEFVHGIASALNGSSEYQWFIS